MCLRSFGFIHYCDPQFFYKAFTDPSIGYYSLCFLKSLHRAGCPAAIVPIHWTGVVAEIGQKPLCLSGVLGTGFLGNGAGRRSWRNRWRGCLIGTTQLSGLTSGLRNNLASVSFNITLSSRLGTLTIPVAPAAGIVIVDDSVELIDARIVIDDVPHRFNANAFADTPANFRHGQHVVGADRRLCILQSGALGRAWRLNFRRRGALRVAVALRGRRRTVGGFLVALVSTINQPDHKDDADNARNPFAARTTAAFARAHGFNRRRRACGFPLGFGGGCFSLRLGGLHRCRGLSFRFWLRLYRLIDTTDLGYQIRKPGEALFVLVVITSHGYRPIPFRT